MSDLNTASAIARAIAVANGHPDPDAYVACFEAALAGEQSAPESAPPEAPAAPTVTPEV